MGSLTHQMGWTCLVVGLMALVAQSAAGQEASDDNEDHLALGEALFVHNWARPDEWTRPERLGKGGDGLGPVFNDVSCVACHAVGGPGGAGDNEHNVELLSLVIPRQSRSRTKLVQWAKTLHPQMAHDNLTVMLHRYGFGPSDETYDYDAWRIGVVDVARDSVRQPPLHLPSGAKVDGAALRLSQRNTPAIWGSGLIDRLRRGGGDRLRQQIAIAQAAQGRGVSGRIPVSASGKAGWFGWRGHVEHLPEFVLSACANELGLAVNNHPQPESPRERDAKKTSPRARDLTNAQVVALTKYVGSLPRPEQVLPRDPQAVEQVHAGEQVFEATGCVECHVPDVGFIGGIYSDLLLHDMGSSLADPVSAFPPDLPPRRAGRRGSYSGGSSPSPRQSLAGTRLTHEWRTPPLWGVADSPPYLHDGRAETLDEAIRLHEGEGRRSAREYKALSEAGRSALLAFLGTLRAPQREVTAIAGTP